MAPPSSATTVNSSSNNPATNDAPHFTVPSDLDNSSDHQSSTVSRDEMTNFVDYSLGSNHFSMLGWHYIEDQFLKEIYAICKASPNELQDLVLNHVLVAHENSPPSEQRQALISEILVASVNQLSREIDELHYHYNVSIIDLENDIHFLNQQLRIANRELRRHAYEENVPSAPKKKSRVDSGNAASMSPQTLEI